MRATEASVAGAQPGLCSPAGTVNRTPRGVGVVCDLDGVVWLGGEPLPGVGAAVARMRQSGVPVVFLTNNSSLTVTELVTGLERAGVPVSPDDVLTSAHAAAAVLAADLAPNSRVLVCGGAGVAEPLQDQGFEVVDDGPCDAVVVGWDVQFDYDRLRRLSAAVRAGARFLATNLDPTHPVPGGLLPGNGALVAAVATASGRAPEVAGKPAAPTVAMVRALFARGVVVGDRPSTDGALAASLGWPFALVSSHATGGDAAPAGAHAVWRAPSLVAVADSLVEVLVNPT